MNQDCQIISENLVISQPLYDNALAAQSIYDKYLKDCQNLQRKPNRISEETEERPFVEARQTSQTQEQRNLNENNNDYISHDQYQRRRYQQQQELIQQQYQRQPSLNRPQYYHHQRLMNYEYYPEYYHQRQAQQIQQHNYPHYRHQYDHNGQNIRRNEQGRRRRKEHDSKYALDPSEIAALSEIEFKRSKAQTWDEENMKCTICIGNFEEHDKIRFLPCLHRFHSCCVDSWLATKGSCPLCKKFVRSLVQQFQ